MVPGKIIKEALDRVFEDVDRVFLVSHNRPDMDAIGSCIGMNIICENRWKKTYIIIDDEVETLEKVTRGVIEDIYQDFNIINAKEAKELLTDNSLLIVLDTNKDYMVSVKDYLRSFKEIIVIDHHRMDENTIKTKYLFVDDTLSSTCEEIGLLLSFYGANVTKKYANYLLAGMILDTNKFSKNVSTQTYSVASKLVSDGADASIANNMFLEDYEHDRAVQRIVDNTIFHTYTYAIASDNDNTKNIYDIEDIAKAADYLLKYQVNASFAIAYINEDTVSISARSKGMIDVAKIMSLFGGGGNELSAAARVKGLTIEEIKKIINDVLTPTSNLDIEPSNEKSLTLNIKNN